MRSLSAVVSGTKSPPVRTEVLLLSVGLASLAVSWPAKHAVAALHIDVFLGCAALQALLCLAGAGLVWKAKPSRAAFPIVLGVAALLRLNLIFEAPHLSDDIHRYIWDGRVQAAGINPYRYIPADPQLAFLRDNKIYPNINRREYAPTIYPPLSQMIFLAVTRVSESITWFKTALLVFEALTIWSLTRLLISFGLPKERVLIYAWNPLVLWEFSASGHIDAAMTAFVMLALLARRSRRNSLTGFLLGCAALVKFFPLVILPALYRRWDWKMPTALIATFCAGYLPYLGAGHKVFGFLSGYAKEEGIQIVRLLLLLIALAGVAGFALFRWSKTERGAIVSAGCLGATLLLVLSPRYPWYWIWIVPMLAFLPMPAMLPFFYLTCAALLQYGRWFDHWQWFGLGINPDLALDILQFAPAALMFLALFLRNRKRRGLLPPTARDWIALG